MITMKFISRFIFVASTLSPVNSFQIFMFLKWLKDKNDTILSYFNNNPFGQR